MSNHLIHEKSPYLLQHADNPVDWRPWSPEAFAHALDTDKPVFLSIGYATCHWCHVMAHESFEDPVAARLLNDTFVCIKVDREERPDIDAVYMAACQMISGSGGWPLSIFLTPHKKPFFAATYLPRENRLGQTGLLQLCRQVQQLWQNERPRLIESADKVFTHLSGAFVSVPGADPEATVLGKAVDQIRSEYDSKHGGFQPAPKFPMPHRLQLLLRQYHRNARPEILEMVQRTLLAMRLGGIWDHVGFGFHRYATDAGWQVPHFEKMLYDQALMAKAYLETFQITDLPFYARTAEEIFSYVLRDMTSLEGPFFTAEDADSEGREGKFYLWTDAELVAALGESDARRWKRIFTVSAEGNFAEEASGRRNGANILHLTKPLDQWARELEIPLQALEAQWQKVRRRLFAWREKRMHPLKDDKVLTDWNGLMIAAMADGGRILGKRQYIRTAVRAANWIAGHMTGADGRLQHRYRDGETAVGAFAADYAFFTAAQLALYRATFDPAWLHGAAKLQAQMNADFWDEAHGGFCMTPAHQDDLPVRPREITDGAIPAANSVALQNLLDLFALTAGQEWRDRAGQLLRASAGSIQRHPAAFCRCLMGTDCMLQPVRRVVVVGEPADEAAQRMLASMDRRFDPCVAVLRKTDANASALGEIAPFTRELAAGPGGQARAFVYLKGGDRQTADDPARIQALLQTP